MTKTMPYSLYKASYTEFDAKNYNASKKTVNVELPDYKKPRFPSDWRRSGNRYYTPNGCEVVVWNTGLAENFLVEHWISQFNHSHRTFRGLYAREEVMKYVASFDQHNDVPQERRK